MARIVNGKQISRSANTRRMLGDYAAVLLADPCAYCGQPQANGLDHIVAGEAGDEPEQVWDNVTGACKSCNSSKRAESLLLWIQRRRK